MARALLRYTGIQESLKIAMFMFEVFINVPFFFLAHSSRPIVLCILRAPFSYGGPIDGSFRFSYILHVYLYFILYSYSRIYVYRSSLAMLSSLSLLFYFIMWIFFFPKRCSVINHFCITDKPKRRGRAQSVIPRISGSG